MNIVMNNNNEFETFSINHNLQTLLQLYQQEKNNLIVSNRKNCVGFIIENIIQCVKKEIGAYEQLIKSIEDTLEYWGNYKTYCSEDEEEIFLFYTYFENFLKKLQHDKDFSEQQLKELENFNYIVIQKNIQSLLKIKNN